MHDRLVMLAHTLFMSWCLGAGMGALSGSDSVGLLLGALAVTVALGACAVLRRLPRALTLRSVPTDSSTRIPRAEDARRPALPVRVGRGGRLTRGPSAGFGVA